MTQSNPFEGLIRLLIRRLRALRLSRRVRDVFWTDTMLDSYVFPANISVDSLGQLVLPDLNIRLTKNRHAFFVPQIALARQVADAGEATFFNDAEGGLFVRFGNLTLEIAGPTDFPLFAEVIARHIYHVKRPDSSPQVVWDIGFNVGAVSLYYAMQPEVIAVYGYEPLPVAYQQGLKNMALNPGLAEKITVFPFGVGKADECLTIGYAAWAITSAGAYGMLTPAGRVMPGEKKVTINLQAAAAVLSEIRQAHPEAKLVVKMDCEGSERDIMPALHAAGLLGEIDMAIIETHFPETQELVRMLSESGFRAFNPQSTRDIGMIYAARA